MRCRHFFDLLLFCSYFFDKWYWFSSKNYVVNFTFQWIYLKNVKRWLTPFILHMERLGALRNPRQMWGYQTDALITSPCLFAPASALLGEDTCQHSIPSIVCAGWVDRKEASCLYVTAGACGQGGFSPAEQRDRVSMCKLSVWACYRTHCVCGGGWYVPGHPHSDVNVSLCAHMYCMWALSQSGWELGTCSSFADLSTRSRTWDVCVFILSTGWPCFWPWASLHSIFSSVKQKRAGTEQFSPAPLYLQV